MTETNRTLERKRSTREVDETGFTLIELLIVIVVLGILAAIVVFALGSVTGNADVSSCNSDARTVDVGVQAFVTENPLVTPNGTAGTTWNDYLLAKTLGGPYIQTWPGTANGYAITVFYSGETGVTLNDSPAVTPAAGDVLVNVNQGTSSGNVYDFTQDANACKAV